MRGLDNDDFIEIDDFNGDDSSQKEIDYHMSVIDLIEIPLKHIERYLREKKLEKLKKN